MAGDFFPRKDADFVAWSGNLRRLLVADPQAYGIGEQDAAAYAILDDALHDAHRLATNAATRTSIAVRGNRDARAAAERMARGLAGQIKANMAVSDAQKAALGFNPRGRGGRHPLIRPPGAAPGVLLTLAGARRVDVRLFDLEVTGRRARPRGAAGAQVFTFQGDSAPEDVRRWRFRGAVTTPTRTIEFGDDLPPGAQVWVCARWYSPRGETGPVSSAIPVRLPGDGVSTMRGLRAAA